MSVVIDGNLGITTPAETVQGALTTTGNTILGDATTDTLTVGVTGIVKDASGNVGIGTASPTVKLDVVTSGGAGLISNTSYRAAAGQSSWVSKFARGTSSSPTIVVSGDTIGSYESYPYNGTNFSLQTASISTLVTGSVTSSSIPTAIVFSTDAAGAAYSNERMRIDSNGNVLVGTTTARSSYITTVCDATYNGVTVTADSTVARTSCSFRNPNGSVGSITTSASATAYNTSSDYRLKENIQPMIGALATISQLKPVTYKWKVDGSDGQGFIAHELDAVVPGCVTGEKDAVDAEGNPVHQGIDTSFLVATLTAAIQELKAIVDAQAVRIAALES